MRSSIAAQPQAAAINAASITSAAGDTPNPILTVERQSRMLVATNTLDAWVWLTLSYFEDTPVISNFLGLGPGMSTVLDLNTNRHFLDIADEIGVRYIDAQPGSGRLTVTVL